MIKIVIVSGGTGSIALQNGLNNLFGIENYKLDVVINAYDNGKSTGACRMVFDNKILGPSDLRKNQLTLFEIIYRNELKDKQSYKSKIYKLFKLRFTASNFQDYYQKACDYINSADYLSIETKKHFLRWIDYFFYEEADVYRKTILNINFYDFSLSNIFYASCAAMNDYSLRKAGTEMARILGINDSVHLISDVSLLLKAETESGYRIEDEGEIVSWDNPDDKIIRAILCNENNEEYLPYIDEKNPGNVKAIFENADIIIFSSGTQWSSLIPTYMHKGFRELIKRAKAKKYLVMNNVEDHDMYGCSAEEVLRYVGKFLDLEEIAIVINDNAVNTMRQVPDNYSSIHGKLSEIGNKRHIPEAVAGIIIKDYFDIDKVYALISDLDGTLWDEMGDEHTKTIGAKNLMLFQGMILSGNTYEHVSEIVSKYFINKDKNLVYCDYGNTFFSMDLITNKRILSEEFLIEDDLKKELEEYREFNGKSTVRGGVICTIKPLTERVEKLALIKKILKKYGNKYEAKIAGRTSIDVMRCGFDKAATLQLILMNYGLNPSDVLYIGNELDSGNEVCVKRVGVKTLQVNDVFEMYMFLKTCQYYQLLGREQ